MANSKKISELITTTSLQDTDFFTLINNSANFKVSFSDFKNELGVTGAISSIGNGTPNLIDNGNNNYSVRAVEGAKGIVASTSPTNGLEVATSFIQNAAGAHVIDDLNANQLKFKTLLAGNEINISESSDFIQISRVSSVQSTKTVVVSQESDFPAPVNGVITLEPQTNYFLVDDVTTSNRFIWSFETIISASAATLIKLAYTGTDTMFTGVDSDGDLLNISLDAPNGSFFDFSSPSKTSFLNCSQVVLKNCQTIGSFDDSFIFNVNGMVIENIVTNGVSFSGDGGYIFFRNALVGIIQAGSVFDLGTSTWNGITLSSVVVNQSLAGTTFLTGAVDSGNINTGGLGFVANVSLNGDIAPRAGITSSEIRWQFSINDNMQDTVNNGLLALENNALVTTISDKDTPVKINGLFTVESGSRFSGDTTGRLIYTGEKDELLDIDATTTMLIEDGNADEVSIYIAINGNPITKTKKQATTGTSAASSITALWQHNFTNGDYIEVWTENNTDSTNIICKQAVLRVG